jgi:hypothetical protein
MPAGTDTLARLVRDDATPLLVHPLGALELRQQRVPLEAEIDRIGAASVSARRVHLADPRVGGAAAAVVAHAHDAFPAGHFLTLTQDQQAARPDFETFPSGMQVSASRDPVYGGDAAAVSVPYAWETVYPHEELDRGSPSLRFGELSRLAFRTSAVANAARARGNPYLAPTAPADALRVEDFGRAVIRRASDHSAPLGAVEIMTTTEAARRMGLLAADDAEATLTLVAAGVVA